MPKITVRERPLYASLRYTGHQVEDQVSLLMKAAGDSHGRVRLETIAAASWLSLEIWPSHRQGSRQVPY